jgi:hypothetical protein
MSARGSCLGSARYEGSVGCERVFFIAVPDELHAPGAPTSGTFSSSAEAAATLRWLRRGNPLLRLYRRLVLVDVLE